jgi:sugar O-acyltransferase (sialic acid O-acetyltransferase NeuD family)
MQKKNLVIFGAGEIAELAYYYFTHDSDYRVVGFSCDDEYFERSDFLGLPLVKFSDICDSFPPETCEAHVALSYQKLNRIREEKYLQLKNLGYGLASYVSTRSVYWNDLKHGDNCFILENQTIQPTAEIGNNVMIWSGNHLGHGCKISDHVYISSHVCISGHTTIGKRCFIGVNSAFKDFIAIGDDVFIAMGSCVTKNIESGSVVLGAKSTVLESESAANIKLKKTYFGLEL